MPSIKEVKETFETIVSDNNIVIGKLDEAAMEAQQKRVDVEDDYQEQLSQMVLSFFLPIDPVALKNLSSATGFDFEDSYKNRMTASDSAKRDLVSLTADYNGSVEGIKEKLDGFSKDLAELTKNKGTLGKTIEVNDGHLKPVNDFNKHAKEEGLKALNEQSIAYFDSKHGFSHVVGMVFNSHYRQGRSLIKKFKKLGTTIPEAQKQQVADAAVFEGVLDKHTKLLQQTAKVTITYKSVQAIGAKVESEDSIIADLSGRMIKMLEDPVVFNKAAQALQDKMPKELVEVRAKIEGFKRIERGMHLRANSLRKASGQLEKQLPKLRKAVRKNGSKKVTVDLDKIRKTFRATQKSNTHTAAEMRKATASIADFKSDKAASRSPSTVSSSPSYSSGPLDFYVNMMIFDMLIHDHHHHDIAASAPDEQSVQSIMGDATGMDGLSGDFNDVSGGADLGGIDADMADMGSMDIDTSSFDVPDIGGGFDAGGGGFDFGGFDF